MSTFKLIQSPENPFQVLHVATGPGTLDELGRRVSYLATGDGVMFVDTGSLKESDSDVAKELLKVIPDDFEGIVYLTR